MGLRFGYWRLDPRPETLIPEICIILGFRFPTCVCALEAHIPEINKSNCEGLSRLYPGSVLGVFLPRVGPAQ